MNTTSLFGTTQKNAALALLGGDALGDVMPALLKQAVVAAANNGGGGGGGGAVWGAITGTLSSQTDLQTALNAKASLAANTFTGRQTIALGSTNTGALAVSGYSLTGSDTSAMFDLAGTWNTSGVATAIKLSLTDTASASGSLLMDLQVGATSRVTIGKTGKIYSYVSSPSSGNENLVLRGYGSNLTIYDDDGFTVRGSFAIGRWTGSEFVTANQSANVSTNGIFVGSATSLQWSNSSVWYGTIDLTVSRAAAATLQLGVNDATTPTAQALKAHDVITGTGASMTIAGGTGSVAGGAVVLATSATTGTATPRLTVKASGVINIAGIPTSSTGLSSGDIYSDGGFLSIVP